MLLANYELIGKMPMIGELLIVHIYEDIIRLLIKTVLHIFIYTRSLAQKV